MASLTVATARATPAIKCCAAARNASAIRKNHRVIRGPLSLGRPSVGTTPSLAPAPSCQRDARLRAALRSARGALRAQKDHEAETTAQRDRDVGRAAA